MSEREREREKYLLTKDAGYQGKSMYRSPIPGVSPGFSARLLKRNATTLTPLGNPGADDRDDTAEGDCCQVPTSSASGALSSL